MDCRGVEDQEILERYLLGQLSDPDREEFEQHFFACDSCFSQLQTELALQDELRQHPPHRGRASGVSLRQFWGWRLAFAFAVVALVAVILWYAVPRPQPEQHAGSAPPVTTPQTSPQTQQLSTPASSLDELAKVEAPSYSPIVLRGTEDEAHQIFRKAMRHYVKNDYAGAIPGLRTAAKASPEMPSFHFYLGACYLLSGQTDRAIESFRKTASLANPTYSGPAHFYLAKAYLRKKEVPAAEQEFQTTIRLGGSNAAEAQQILYQLSK